MNVILIVAAVCAGSALFALLLGHWLHSCEAWTGTRREGFGGFIDRDPLNQLSRKQTDCSADKALGVGSRVFHKVQY